MMEKNCNCQNSESGSAVVYEVTGEPAIVINGLPNETPIGSVPIHPNEINDAEPSDDPCFGEWLEGRHVRKLFGDQYYSGRVVKYDSETNWYRVVYEDSDFEDLEWHELEKVMLPLNISLPLITLAMQRCKPTMSVSDSEKRIPKSRKCHVKNAGIMELEPVLSQKQHPSELKNDLPVEVNVVFESNPKLLKLSNDEVQSMVVSREFEEILYLKSGENAGKAEVHQTLDANSEEKMLELLQRRHATELNGEILKVIHKEATEEETSKKQRENQKQSWRTARAEKQKRRDRAWDQAAVTEVKKTVQGSGEL